jgi:hypothetical protein
LARCSSEIRNQKLEIRNLLFNSLWEARDRVRSVFAEAFFLLMRKRRYGIGPCGVCNDIDLLTAQVGWLNWEDKRRKEEELVEELGESSS